jgi:deoxyribonuclease-4
MIIGSHVSFNKKEQLLGSVRECISYGANTFMFYTGAPQNTVRMAIDFDLKERAFSLMKDNGIDFHNVIVHAPYIVNLANEKNFDFSINFLREELKRVSDLGFDKIVLHPGSHVGIGSEKAISNIVYCLNEVLVDSNVKILLETMAGKGTEVGANFTEIKQIIDGVDNKECIGVCLDTCHIHDAGYDVSDFDSVLLQFDNIIGLDRLLCIHINDSKNVIGAHKDRHENIGYGFIGFDNMINIIYNERVKDVPKILETPYVKCDEGSFPPYKFEIEMIKDKKFNNNLYDDIVNYYK